MLISADLTPLKKLTQDHPLAKVSLMHKKVPRFCGSVPNTTVNFKDLRGCLLC